MSSVGLISGQFYMLEWLWSGPTSSPTLRKHRISDKKGFYYLSLLREGDDKYTIHGLWPQYDAHNYPTYCKRVTFSYNALMPIMERLHKFWASDREKDSEFWKHEWYKHGSCVFTPMSELDYFTTALDLFDEARVYQLPDKYYDERTGTCLIPVSADFKFITNHR